MRSLVLSLWIVAGCVAAPAPIMSWPEYAKLDPAWPYVIEIGTARGRLLYFGAAHTFDPADPQVAQLEEAWTRFRPEIAFTEGSARTYAARDDAVRRGGEPALVRSLALRDEVPVTSLEPSRAEELAALSGRFSREQLKIFYILRDVAQFIERNGASAADHEVERLLKFYAETPGLSGSPRTLAEFQAAFVRHFPGSRSYTEATRAWFDPVPNASFLNELSRATGDYRDQHIVELLVRHVRSGRRVFAVIGGSHVVMQERALRSRLER